MDKIRIRDKHPGSATLFIASYWIRIGANNLSSRS